MKNFTFNLLFASLLLFFSENVKAQCGATAVTTDPPPLMICEGDAIVVNFTPAGSCAGTYEYEVMDGAAVVQAWSATASYNASPITTTTYTVNLRCSACPAIVVSVNFTVDVVEEPTISGNMVVCPGDATTLIASGSTGNFEWWDSQAGGAMLSPNGTLNTPALSSTTTYWIQVSGTAAGGGGSIMITECGLDGAIGGTGSEDYIEISNLYTTPVNTAGWVCAVSNSYTNINTFNATMWSLPASFPPCSVVTRTDVAGTPNYWGNNIFWNSTSNSWAIIIDDVGNVVDFIAWGWTAAQLATFNPTINGFPITLGLEWVGNGCPLPCGSVGGVQYSFARTGNTDNNDSGDFVCQPTSVDVVNPGLSCGWISGLTCPYPATVVVSPSADATITGVGPFCASDPALNLTAVDPGGTWSGNGITDPVNGVFDPATAGVGTHTITYMIPGNCGDTQTTDIVIDPPFSAVITPVGPYCVNDPSFDLNAVDPGGNWTGNGITNAVNGTFDPATAGAGTHTITYTISGSCGDVQTTDIDVFLQYDATITPAGPFCETDPSVVLNAVDGGGTWSGNGITNAGTGAFDPALAGGGTHTITYSIPGACGDMQTIDIIITDQLDATITQVGPFCETDLAVILNAVDAGGTWSGTGIMNAANGNFSPSVAGVGTHTITYTISGSCGDAQNIDIIVNGIPVVNFISDVNTGCPSLGVVFTNTSVPVGSNCLWNFGNSMSSTNCGFATTSYDNSGCFDVTLTVTENGCTNSQTISNMICVIENPVAQFNVSGLEMDITNPDFSFYNTSLYSTSQMWDFGDGFSSATNNPSHSYADAPASYEVCLIAYNSLGCIDSACAPINIVDILLYYVPNTFTPDGDAFNQTFNPVFTSGFDPYDFNFVIYNRWGETVWESHDATVGWDGTFGGKQVQQGIYTWKVDFKTAVNDERITDNGHVNVIR